MKSITKMALAAIVLLVLSLIFVQVAGAAGPVTVNYPVDGVSEVGKSFIVAWDALPAYTGPYRVLVSDSGLNNLYTGTTYGTSVGVVLSGDPSGGDGDTLTVKVQASDDGGATWDAVNEASVTATYQAPVAMTLAGAISSLTTLNIVSVITLGAVIVIGAMLYKRFRS